MSSQSDDFWSGMLIGSMLSNKKPAEKKKKGSFLDGIIGILGLILFIFLWSSFSLGVAIFVFIGIPIVIGIIIGIRKSRSQTIALAWDHYHEGKYSQALKECQPYCESNCDAAYLKGYCLLHGLGCDKNPEIAFNYMEIAQDKNAEAQAVYADMLIHGTGCKQDIQAGKSALISSCNKGCSLAKLRLGEYLIQGINGFSQNYSEGMQNLREVAEEGIPYAQWELGLMLCSEIEGIQSNPELGLNYIRQAANTGVQEAIDYLNEHRN